MKRDSPLGLGCVIDRVSQWEWASGGLDCGIAVYVCAASSHDTSTAYDVNIILVSASLSPHRITLLHAEVAVVVIQ